MNNEATIKNCENCKESWTFSDLSVMDKKLITHRTLESCMWNPYYGIWMDGSKESERDKLKLTFEACNDGEDVAVFRTR